MASPPSQYSQTFSAEYGFAARRLPPKNQYSHDAYTSQDRQHIPRQRAPIACTECRKRRIRCSGPEDGRCTKCTENGRECRFVPVSGSGPSFVPVNAVWGRDGPALRLYGAYGRQLVPAAGQRTALVPSQRYWRDDRSSNTTNISPHKSLGGQQYYTPPACFPPSQDCRTYAPGPLDYIPPPPRARDPFGTPPALPNPRGFTLPPINELVSKR